MARARSSVAAHRRHVALVAVVTLAPAALVVVVGWLLYRQDRDAVWRDLASRRERAADLVAFTLDTAVADVQLALETSTPIGGLDSAGDAVVVSFGPSTVRVTPPQGLLHVPANPRLREAPPGTFASAEALESRTETLGEAADAYRTRSASPDTAVRAEALVRLARVLDRLGERAAALDTLAEASTLRDVAIAGTPVDLFARWARARLLAERGADEASVAEARALRQDLIAARWSIDRSRFEFLLADLTRWVGGGESPGPVARALAAAVERIWHGETGAGRGCASRTESIAVEGTLLLVVAASEAGACRVFVAAQGYVEREWLAPVRATLDREGLQVALVDSPDHAIAEHETRRSAAPRRPFTIVVGHADLARELAGIEGRQRLWFLGLAMLALLLAAAVYVVARAVSRELAVARLQADFVAAVSHEFRTPLTTLRQLTEILLDERLVAEGRRRAYYEALARQTDRLRRLVESLLDFGRVEAGRSPYRREPLDGCALVREVVDEFRREEAASGFEVTMRVPDRPVLVQGDREALANALWNLLDNAVKYSPERKVIAVEVEVARTKLEIRVRDRGLGIAQAEQHAIFGKFIRGANARAEGIPGTGIGLAMVQHIVAAHGGSVGVESEPGAGSTFTLRLPAPEVI